MVVLEQVKVRVLTLKVLHNLSQKDINGGGCIPVAAQNAVLQ
jgi:hypothetical protein